MCAEAPPCRILVVDDEENIRKSILRLFAQEDYSVLTAASGAEGVEILKQDHDVAVIISDQRMPGMTGVEFLAIARDIAPDAIRVLLTGYSSKEAAVDSINRGGAHYYLEKPWKDSELLSVVFDSVQRFSMIRENHRLHQVIREQNSQLQEWNLKLEERVREQTEEISRKNENLLRLNERLEKNFHNSIVAFASLVEIRSQEEASHSLDTANLSRILCERIGMSLAETAEVVVAARLHDIGKIGLPEEVARKTVELMTPQEYLGYKNHSVLGQTALDTVDDLRDAAVLIRHHHEKWDGTGFPDRLSGDQIPLGSRVIALADFIDRFVRTRPGQDPSQELQRVVLLRLRRHFDPVFGDYVKDILRPVYGERLNAFRPTEVEVHPKDLRPGLVLARDLRSGTGFLLLCQGTVLNDKNIEAIERYHRMDPFRSPIFIKTPAE